MGKKPRAIPYKIILVILSCSISIYPNIKRTAEFKQKSVHAQFFQGLMTRFFKDSHSVL